MRSAHLAALGFLLSLASTAALAGPAEGNALYHSYCVGCHGDPPRGGPERAANQPLVIRNALNTVAAMKFLGGELNDSEVADIAAYIGTLSAPAPQGPNEPALDYTDMWYNRNESGWGMNVIQHDTDIIFGVIFTYEAPNRPMWFVLPFGTWTSPTTYSGTLYRTTGAPANVDYRPPRVFEVGTATILFTSPSTANITYSVDGIQVTKTLERQSF